MNEKSTQNHATYTSYVLAVEQQKKKTENWRDFAQSIQAIYYLLFIKGFFFLYVVIVVVVVVFRLQFRAKNTPLFRRQLCLFVVCLDKKMFSSFQMPFASDGIMRCSHVSQSLLKTIESGVAETMFFFLAIFGSFTEYICAVREKNHNNELLPKYRNWWPSAYITYSHYYYYYYLPFTHVEDLHCPGGCFGNNAHRLTPYALCMQKSLSVALRGAYPNWKGSSCGIIQDNLYAWWAHELFDYIQNIMKHSRTIFIVIEGTHRWSIFAYIGNYCLVNVSIWRFRYNDGNGIMRSRKHRKNIGRGEFRDVKYVIEGGFHVFFLWLLLLL